MFSILTSHFVLKSRSCLVLFYETVIKNMNCLLYIHMYGCSDVVNKIILKFVLSFGEKKEIQNKNMVFVCA